MGGRILLIEDEGNIREAIGFILSRAGWEVQGHGNGATAIEAVTRTKPDMVILDIMLPGLSGFEILRALRDGAETAQLPVLMLTAKGQARDQEAAFEMGADAYLTKPFSNADLLATVARLAQARATGDRA
ncbi:response regulator transcription factor [Roseicyclus sp.]|jgi:DNA-binding response OmpR family regulator|uniref:response regulator transcription factor n=1 Tax=Roseicyclus sp. TaxID=1914329 RepID=UPI003BB09E2A|nr:response regulator [Pseudomonadota bacterium]